MVATLLRQIGRSMTWWSLTAALCYDRRTDPDNLKIAVWRASSLDGGRSFSPNVAVTADPVFPGGYDPSLSPTYMGDYMDIKAVLG